MKHRRVLKIGSLLLVLALVFSFACAPPGGEEQPAPEKVITVGLLHFPIGLNPFVASSHAFFTVEWDFWNNLYDLGPEGTLIPDLAKEVVVSPDRKTYTITIRDNAQWQDGVPLTAHDVAFTYNYIIDNEMSWYASICECITEIKAIDDYTVELTLDKAWNQEVLNNNPLHIIMILPQHIWQDVTPEEAMGKEDIPASMLIGSGPYQVVEFVRDEYMRLRVTPQAREELGAKVDEYIFKGYADSSVMLQDLIAGNIDAVYGVELKAIPALEKVPEITIIPNVPARMDEVVFNCWDHAYEEGRETHPHPALRDVRVKQALDWAFDEKKATKMSYGEYGIVGYQYLTTWLGDFSHTELDIRGYDLDRARQILDDAGYLDTDGDGIRETAEGQPLEFDVWTCERGRFHTDVATMWAKEAKKIGIELNVSQMDSNTLWSYMNPNGEFDIALWDWSTDPDPWYLLCTMLCNQAVKGGWSEAGYCNPEYDRLYEEEALAATHEERRQLLWEMQELLYKDMPYINFAYYPSDTCAIRNDKVDVDVKVIEACGYGTLGKYFILTADTVS